MRTALCALIWMALILSASAEPSPARVAVISDADNQNLASLITTELSDNQGIRLVERNDLAKVGDELKLQQLASSDSVALGKLIGADGLVFISKGPSGLQVRFTAVGLGYALFDDQIASETDLPQLAKSIAHRVIGYAPKLKLDPAKVIPISVLNLRADYVIGDYATVERKLTLLLESRLASLPDYVVLERRHAWSLGLEHSLSTPAKPLLQGAYVVDGTLTLPAQGTNEITTHLRLRSPSNQQTLLEIRGQMNDMPSLVEKMTTEIRKAAGTGAIALPWEPEKEAREYLLEGDWGRRNHANDAALEALDSAELLGEKAPDLLAVRIPVLCALAAGSEPFLSGHDPLPDDPSPDRRIDAALRAIDDQTRYQKEHLESKLQILDDFHTGDGRTGYLAELVGRAASKLLVMLDRTKNPRAGEVRSAIRVFANYDPLNGQIPGDWSTAIEFADDWSVSMDEELAYYRTLASKYPWAAYEGWRLRWGINPNTFCAHFLATPEARQAAYFKFLRDLVNDPVARPAALLYLAERCDAGQKDAACRALYNDLWAEREDLLKTKRFGYIVNYAFELEQNRRPPVADPKLIALLHFVLQPTTDSSLFSDEMWCPEIFPTDAAPRLWSELQDYEKRYEAAKGKNGYFAGMNQRYTDRFCTSVPSDSQPPPLVVNRFWYPKDSTRRLLFTGRAFVPTPDGLWVVGILDGIPEQGGLYHIDLDTFQTTAMIRAQASNPRDLLVTKDAVYVICLTRDDPATTMIERFDRALNTWNEHEVPGSTSYPGFDTIYEVAGQLYLGLKRPDGESALARYNAETGGITVLASSRRRPAENQFDDRLPYLVCNVFAGPHEKPCAMIDMANITTGSYYINEQPGPWPSLTQFGFLIHSQTDGVRTLLYGPGSVKTNADIVVMIDPAKNQPELWLGNPAPPFQSGFPGSEKAPRPELPPWARKAVWPKADHKELNASDYGFRGDDLFALVNRRQPTKITELVWYRHGDSKPIHIPLSFEIDSDTDKALSAFLPEVITKRIDDSGKTNNIVGLTVTPLGICFTPGEEGFWYLPFTDLDAYMKALALDQSPPAPPVLSHSKVPKMNVNSTGEDGLDPGDPSSFP
jgi:hypothetical protein